MTYYGEEKKTEHPYGCKVMTWEDAEEMSNLNAKCHWGFSAWDCLRFLADHMEANSDVEHGNDPLEAYKCMECIEWRLEDANFHTFNGFLHAHEYDKALAWIGEDYADYLK